MEKPTLLLVLKQRVQIVVKRLSLNPLKLGGSLRVADSEWCVGHFLIWQQHHKLFFTLLLQSWPQFGTLVFINLQYCHYFEKFSFLFTLKCFWAENVFFFEICYKWPWFLGSLPLLIKIPIRFMCLPASCFAWPAASELPCLLRAAADFSLSGLLDPFSKEESFSAAAFFASSFLCRHVLTGSANILTFRRKEVRTWMLPFLFFSSWPSVLPNSSTSETLYNGSTWSCSSSGVWPISRLSSLVSVQTCWKGVLD